MIFVSGLGAPETPRLLPDGSWLCVEMAPDRGGVSQISADGRSVRLIARTGMPNGCLPAGDGSIWVAETHPNPALLRVTMAGAVETWLEGAEGEPFLFPNDLCFGPDGALYLTDSGMRMADWAPGGRVRPDWATAAFDGRVYRIDLAARQATLLGRGFRFTNGLAFGPDGLLYVNEMITGDVYRYRPSAGFERFGNVLSPAWSGGFRGPDGMAFGADGRLYCTVYGEAAIAVLDAAGTVVDRLPTIGRNPTNVAFGPAGQHRLYVTDHERGQMEVIAVETDGLPLHPG